MLGGCVKYPPPPTPHSPLPPFPSPPLPSPPLHSPPLHSPQTAKILHSVVLFDALATDFTVLGAWLVLYGGHQRSLTGTPALQGAGLLLRQRIAPPDKVHIKVLYSVLSVQCPHQHCTCIINLYMYIHASRACSASHIVSLVWRPGAGTVCLLFTADLPQAKVWGSSGSWSYLTLGRSTWPEA